MKTHTVLYHIQRGHLPSGAEACLMYGIRAWEKALGGRVKFVEDRAFADWSFQFAEVETFPNHSAECTFTDAVRRLIVFDPRETWKMNAWQRMFGRKGWDLRAMTMHEIGHAFGLRHSVDVTSIMHPKTRTVRIDQAYVEMVLEKLNLK